MSKLSDFLGKLAPTIASALGGPLAGAGVQALQSALGMPSATQPQLEKLLVSGTLTGEQLAAIKQAEGELQAKLKALDIDLERIDHEDRSNARAMQVANKSLVPGTLATLMVLGFFSVLWGMMSGELKTSDSQALLVMLGALSAGFGSALNFYFGSSHGSSAKDATIARLK
jgi:hypothetical protein